MSMNEIKEHQMYQAISQLEVMGMKVHRQSGSHLSFIDLLGGVYDFWPTTGKWKKRGSPFTQDSGLQGIVQELEGELPAAQIQDKDLVIAELRKQLEEAHAKLNRIKSIIG